MDGQSPASLDSAAIEPVEAALRRDPRDVEALMKKAQLIEQAGFTRAAAQVYGAALSVAPGGVGAAFDHARAVHGAYLDEMQATLEAAVGSVEGAEARRTEAFIGRMTGRRRVFHQQPMRFHYPGLPEIEFHDREAFPWLDELEAATGEIRAELEAILEEDGEDLTPYVNFPEGAPLDQWAELNRSHAWGAFHLIFDGREVAWNAARAPKTMAMLARLPQPRAPGHSPSALFSVLQPKTHIPSHTGVSNTRLITHLPLIVPPGCRFRVGAETREWREGEAFVFDDTIEHEAWNDGDQRRTVLIFDVWNPALSETERATVAALMAAMDRFTRGG